MDERLRASAGFACGALCLHQLRYLAGYGGDTGAALAREGHGYLGLVGPLVALLCAVALGQFAVALQRGARADRRRSLTALWPLAAAGLLAVYLVQESLEGVLAGGLAGLFGAGGWTAAPIAIVVGLTIALLLRGATALL
ncbi:MAG: hypothetical protein ACRDL0_13445, partial [Thermoleophilaceae bacterium]